MRIAIAWMYYRCQGGCARTITAVITDEGNAPMAITCPDCHGEAHAAIHSKDIPRKEWPNEVSRQPYMELYRPSLNEKKRLRVVAPKAYEWVLNGGLLRRKPGKEYRMK